MLRIKIIYAQIQTTNYRKGNASSRPVSCCLNRYNGEFMILYITGFCCLAYPGLSCGSGSVQLPGTDNFGGNFSWA